MQLLLGLGGNVGDVAGAFAAAADALARRFSLVAVSSLWRTAAEGPAQPDYLNASALIASDVHPLRCLAFCLRLEAAAGRTRDEATRWGPRPLDLDLLLTPGIVLLGPALTLPHPRLGRRAFALLPAVELAPEWVHPRLHRSLASLAAETDPTGCERIGPFPAFPGTMSS